ncbi:4Fe-4S binding protein [Oscillospiraceae bacterium CM]|nr:4Fe-4S binding protein [Oscillospiraceae bacterium CM]
MLQKTISNSGGTDTPTLTINKKRCPQNHPCPSVRVCPVGALHQKGFDAPIVDEKSCISCGKCVKFCPMRAIAFA